jgi:hypothetical protein
MNDYLSSSELADLIGCKPNQRTIMANWLAANQWPFVVDRNGIPKVARAYRDKKRGIGSEGDSSSKYDVGPNRDAFKK